MHRCCSVTVSDTNKLTQKLHLYDTDHYYECCCYFVNVIAVVALVITLVAPINRRGGGTVALLQLTAVVTNPIILKLSL